MEMEDGNGRRWKRVVTSNVGIALEPQWSGSNKMISKYLFKVKNDKFSLTINKKCDQDTV